MPSVRNVHIIDDDEAVRASVERLLRSAGFVTISYANLSDFLNGAPALSAGCVLLDIRLGAISGLEVQAWLNQIGFKLPVIVMTAYGDIPTAVRAMKAGAIDFLEKPIDAQHLLAALDAAIRSIGPQECGEDAAAAERITALSPRERDVLEGLMAGASNKIIAFNLGISVRTVEIHRARMLKRLRVHSLSEAVRLAVLAGR